MVLPGILDAVLATSLAVPVRMWGRLERWNFQDFCTFSEYECCKQTTGHIGFPKMEACSLDFKGGKGSHFCLQICVMPGDATFGTSWLVGVLCAYGCRLGDCVPS